MLDGLLEELAEQQITDVHDETFVLFSSGTTSNGLGVLDPHAAAVEVSLGGQDLTIHQSPGVLNSNRAGGTTGAVVWKASVHFANWMSLTSNILFQHNVLDSSSIVLELGAGTGLVGLAMARHVSRFILTDQDYVMKLLRKNIEENFKPVASTARASKGRRDAHRSSTSPRLETLVLDWETSNVGDVARLLAMSDDALASQPAVGVDVVVACDCIFNEALVDPFVQACVSICALRSGVATDKPTVCVIAQQLRSPEVFELWLSRMTERFRVWRLPSLDESSGYAVHLAILPTG